MKSLVPSSEDSILVDTNDLVECRKNDFVPIQVRETRLELGLYNVAALERPRVLQSSWLESICGKRF